MRLCGAGRNPSTGKVVDANGYGRIHLMEAVGLPEISCDWVYVHVQDYGSRSLNHQNRDGLGNHDPAERCFDETADANSRSREGASNGAERFHDFSSSFDYVLINAVIRMYIDWSKSTYDCVSIQAPQPSHTRICGSFLGGQFQAKKTPPAALGFECRGSEHSNFSDTLEPGHYDCQNSSGHVCVDDPVGPIVCNPVSRITGRSMVRASTSVGVFLIQEVMTMKEYGALAAGRDAFFRNIIALDRETLTLAKRDFQVLTVREDFLAGCASKLNWSRVDPIPVLH